MLSRTFKTRLSLMNLERREVPAVLLEAPSEPLMPATVKIEKFNSSDAAVDRVTEFGQTASILPPANGQRKKDKVNADIKTLDDERMTLFTGNAGGSRRRVPVTINEPLPITVHGADLGPRLNSGKITGQQAS